MHARTFGRIMLRLQFFCQIVVFLIIIHTDFSEGRGHGGRGGGRGGRGGGRGIGGRGSSGGYDSQLGKLNKCS